jgi:hypothetical protein
MYKPMPFFNILRRTSRTVRKRLRHLIALNAFPAPFFVKDWSPVRTARPSPTATLDPCDSANAAAQRRQAFSRSLQTSSTSKKRSRNSITLITFCVMKENKGLNPIFRS